MDRHFESIYEGAGFLCGDCENEGTPSPLKRKDHFLTHLHKHHGLEEVAWKACEKCPWPICQPENKKQSRLFSTQSSMERHILLRHEGKFLDSSQRREAGSSWLPHAQGKWSLQFYLLTFQIFSSFFLPFIKAGVADQEYSLTGIKRAHDHEHQGAKRPRCGDCAIDAQATFDFQGQRDAPFVVASISFHSMENTENFGTGRPAHGLSGCQSSESEIFVLNVSPVDYLALLELSGYSECCGSYANHAL
jgi:hypothetical protein